MPTRLIALFNLRPGIDRAEYEHWARTVDLPAVNALASVDRFEVMRVAGRLAGSEPAPYDYVELIDVADMDRFGADAATPAMTRIAGRFNELVEVIFLRTEPLAADQP